MPDDAPQGEDPQASIMDEMLNRLKVTSTPAALYLKNGIKLIGKVLRYDEDFVLFTLERNVPDDWGMVIDRAALSSVQRHIDKPREPRRND